MPLRKLLPPWLLLALALALALPACAQTREAGSPTHWVELGGERFAVEIADTPALRARGLMFRDHLPPGQGMLFIHDVEELQAFWMKNTRIALDILYFDADLALVSVSADTPPCTLGDRCPVYPSAGPALYTLELNAGEARRLRVGRGDRLRLDPGLKARHRRSIP